LAICVTYVLAPHRSLAPPKDMANLIDPGFWLLSELLSWICQLAFASSLTWRNWQTRTAQDRMGQPVEVRVLS
jgi:hypothetical protein